jgi:tetratricopeptide (TPR) repeat protein
VVSSARLLVLVPVAAATVAYAATLGAGFAYDDEFAIRDNPVVTGSAPAWEAFARDFWGRPASRTIGSYRPAAVLSLALDWRVGGGAPWPFHATNVAIHAAVVAATFLAWRRIAGERAALAGATLLAVLAAPAEAVQAIVGRSNLLFALFGTLGLAAHRRQGRAGAAGAAAAFGVALLSNEAAVALPLAYVALDLACPAGDAGGEGNRAGLRPGRLLAYAAVGAAYLAARHAALGAIVAHRPDGLNNPLADGDLAGRVLGAAAVLARRYAWGFLDPLARVHDCSAPACGPADPGDAAAWAGLALVAAAVALPFVLRRRLPAASGGIAWAGLLFLPASNLLFLGPTAYGERLTYAPAAGLCVAVAVAVEGLASRMRRTALAWAALAAVGLGNAVAVQARNADWSSADALAEAGVAATPDNAKARYNAAHAAFQRGDLDAAEREARLAIELRPSYLDPRALLGGILDRRGLPDQAEAAFTAALALGRDTNTTAQHATFLARHGRYDEADSEVRRGLALDPEDPRLIDLAGRIAARRPPR